VVSGEVPVSATTAVRTVVRVWITRDGQLTDAPLQDTQVAGQADFAATFGVIALAATLTVTGVLARRALDKHRMAVRGCRLVGNRAALDSPGVRIRAPWPRAASRRGGALARPAMSEAGLSR
jgi:hypothetical protein